MGRLDARLPLGGFLREVGDEGRQSHDSNCKRAQDPGARGASQEPKAQAAQTDGDPDDQARQGAGGLADDEVRQADTGDGDRNQQRPERPRSAHPSILALANRGLDSVSGFKVYGRAMTTYRISYAARRTGLPTSTLRDDERIGLLPPPERTDSGYRAYEERALGDASQLIDALI